MTKLRTLAGFALIGVVALAPFPHSGAITEGITKGAVQQEVARAKAPQPQSQSVQAAKSPAKAGPKNPDEHPCVRGIINGGKPGNVFVLMQYHMDPVKETVNDQTATSQILIYHLLNDLIRNYGVKAVLFEGLAFGRDVKRDFEKGEGPMLHGRVHADAFRKCISESGKEMLSALAETDPGHATPRNLEDLCLAVSLMNGDPFANQHVLLSEHSGVFFTGLEEDMEVQKKEMEGIKTILGELRRDPSLKDDPEFKKRIEAVDAQLNDMQRDRFAIKAAVSKSPVNSAVVMGAYHEKRLQKAIEEIPYAGRPTFCFVPHSCQHSEEFYIWPDAINAARFASGK